MSLPSAIHLVGVGGAGMSALARILSGRGHRVTGSDLRGGGWLDGLAELGLEVWQGHRPERAAAADLVVASSAVPDTDPELVAARAAGVAVWRRPRLLRALTSIIPTVGPTGTHGKTTTTALLVTALRALGADPSFVVGGDLVEVGTNAHLGGDDLMVLEVDEAFGTFEEVALIGLVVTSVEPDHLDHFGTPAEMEEAFVRVVRHVAGPVLACGDDPGAARVAERTGAVTYGFHPGSAWQAAHFEAWTGGSRFRLAAPRGEAVDVELPRAGLHVARNAAGALALLGEMGWDWREAASGLARFGGVRRRFESRGMVAGVRIIDDYAHHPTEVAATIAEASSMGARRLWAVFQPHLYSRTRDLHRQFGSALAGADRVVVTDVYGAREAPEPGITGDLVAVAARRSGAAQVDYVPHRADLAAHLAERVESGDMVLILGAGDITLVAGELAVALTERSRR